MLLTLRCVSHIYAILRAARVRLFQIDTGVSQGYSLNGKSESANVIRQFMKIF